MNGEIDELRQLADFVLSNSFPHIAESGEDGYLAMFSEVGWGIYCATRIIFPFPR